MPILRRGEAATLIASTRGIRRDLAQKLLDEAVVDGRLHAHRGDGRAWYWREDVEAVAEGSAR